MNTAKKTKGANKGTTLKYSSVIKELKKMNEPTKINSHTFSKKHNVSTNLVLALQQMGHLKREEEGFVWNKETKGTNMAIAEKARILMNEMTNKTKPTRERPTGKRAYNGRKTKPGTKKKTAKKAAKKASFKKINTTPKTKRPYTKRQAKPVNNDSVKVQLAKKFSQMGDHSYALELLS
jgi:hypothetical protein